MNNRPPASYRTPEQKKAWHKAHYAKNRERMLAERKAYYEKHKDRVKAYRATRKARDKELKREWDLKRHYGIDGAAWDSLFKSQNGRCAICDTDTPNGMGWCVDHSHRSGRVRAILCQPCNFMIGHARERAWVLENAAIYVEGHDVLDDHLR